MRSKFILGLYSADKEILANFIAMWDQSTISNIIKYKSFDWYEKNINNKAENDEYSKVLKEKKEELIEADINELRTMLIFQLASYFNIKLPKRLHLVSLELVGLSIEKKSVQILKKNDDSFDGKSFEDMLNYVFQSLYNEVLKRFADKSENEKEEIVKHILSTINNLPKEQQDRLKKELNADELSDDIIKKAIMAGTLGTAFATTVSIAGFSAYTFATSSLASLAGLFGITLPFGAFSGLTSIIAVLSNPLFLLTSMGGLLYVLNSKSNQSIKTKLSPMIISFISILSIDSNDYLCVGEKHLNYYNSLVNEYEKADEERKKKIESRIKGLKEELFEKKICI